MFSDRLIMIFQISNHASDRFRVVSGHYGGMISLVAYYWISNIGLRHGYEAYKNDRAKKSYRPSSL